MRYDLIGIHGPLNGGKDTVANYLMYKYPSRYGRYAFARPIKQACQVMFGFSDLQLEDRTLKEAVDEFWGFSPRKAMQLLGAEYGRDMLRSDIWIKRAELEHQKNLATDRGTIITDVRYQNEADWIRSISNSLIIYLEVPGLQRDSRYEHSSEGGISRGDRDLVLVNDKNLGLDHLYKLIDDVL